ncbi:MAG: glycosyltransferase [Candidatus Firestonebacteria bacterium]
MLNRPEISIIVLTKNAKENIKRTLSVILTQKISKSFEVIVIDSGSTDGTIDIIKSFKTVRLIRKNPKTFSHGGTRNLGGKLARASKYLVFLNGDAIPKDRNWLSPLIRGLERDKKIAGVFSRHIAKEGCYIYMAGDIAKGMPLEKRVSALSALPFGERETALRRMMWFSTVSCAIRKSFWVKTRFRTDIYMAEDQDWAKSMLIRGRSIVYEPASAVYHSHNYGIRQFFWYNYNSEKAFNIILKSRKNVFFLLPRLIRQLFCSTLETVMIMRVPASKRVSRYGLLGEIIIALLSRYAAIFGELLANI